MQHIYNDNMQPPENIMLAPLYLCATATIGYLKCCILWHDFFFNPPPSMQKTWENEDFEIFLRRKRAQGFGGETAMA